jgi:hypothetical protein
VDLTTKHQLQRVEWGRAVKIVITVALHDNEKGAFEMKGFY